MLNKVFLIGNLTRDPEVRYLPSGTALTEFDLAVNRRFKGREGDQKEETVFIRIVTWSKLAEICGQYLKKGRQVLVEGRLKQDTWEAKDGSGKRSRIDIVAETVQFLGSPSSKEDRSGGGHGSSRPTQSPGPPRDQGGAAGPERTSEPDTGAGGFDQGGTEDDLPF